VVPAAKPKKLKRGNMRQPNFKLGWYVPNKIAALTHFHADVTQEDFMGLVKTGQELLSDTNETFHVIIDNRVVAMSAPASLSQMKQMVSYMNHPQLRWVVVIKPTSLELDTESLPVEHEGKTSLKNVSSLAEAFSFLRDQTNDIDWSKADASFFPNPE
jgi:hypothetical protein